MLHVGQHPDQRHLDLVVELAQPLGLEGVEQRVDQGFGGEGPPGRVERPLALVAAEVELAGRGHLALGQAEAGIAAQQLLEQVLRRPAGSSR